MNLVTLVVFTIVFILGNFVRLPLGNGIALVGLDGVVGVIALIALIDIIRKRQTLRAYRTVIFGVVAFFVAGVISLIANISILTHSELLTAALYLMRWGIYSLLFLAVQQASPGIKKRITQSLFLTGVVIIGIGFVQYLFYPNLRNLFYLGWDDHLYRLFSTFLDPNFASAFFCVFYLFSLDRSLAVPMAKQTFYRWGLYFLTGCSLLALILTYSRTGIIMVVVGTISYFLIRQQMKKIALIVILGFSIGILVLSNFGIEGMNPLRTASSTARIQSAEQAMTLIQKYPLFGVGFDAYRYAMRRHNLSPLSQWETTHAGSGTDNSWLFVLATTGIVGFAAYLFFWSQIMQYILKRNTRAKAVLLATIAALFVGSIFLNVLFFPFLLGWFWILFAVTDYT